MTTRLLALGACLALLLSVSASARQDPSPSASPDQEPGFIDPGYLQVKNLLSENRKTRRDAAEQIVAAGDPGLVFGIVDALFFIPKPLRKEAFEALEGLVDEPTGTGSVGKSYWDWVELVGRLGETRRPTPGYDQWKAVLLSNIDPGYREIFYPGAPTRIRLEEVVPGGVRIDGIPSLDDPPMVEAAEADYLDADEEVFGVVLGGEARAYPLRFLDWHEMLNDRVGTRAITLSYCTLCGSGVLYDAGSGDGPPRRFGTSGLLYRSNKLMFDRRTRSLWSNLYGEPVIGPLASEPEQHRLEILPMTRATWSAWRERHPETTVVQLTKALKKEGRKHGFDYRPGKADEARRGVSFPVWKQSDALDPETEVYTLRLGDDVRAYPLDELLGAGLVEDELGGRGVVLVADAESGAVRAYLRRGGTLHPGTLPRGTLRRAPDDPTILLDDQDRRLRVTESALVPEGFDAEPLDRLPGHFAFWFGWYAFYPQTEIYRAPAATP